jgi:anaerobic selenocysteine-containing dehydrogenase
MLSAAAASAPAAVLAAAAAGWLMQALTALISDEHNSRRASWLSGVSVFCRSCTWNCLLHAVRVSAMVVKEEGIHASDESILPD